MSAPTHAELLGFVERVAQTYSSDWPQRCQMLVKDARRLLSGAEPARPVTCGYPYCGGSLPECRSCIAGGRS